jgi:oxygen-independent coproporphyrinogen-3 oxidase
LISIKAAGAGGGPNAPMDQALLAKHDRPVPRYTSYPTAPHFGPAIGAEAYGGWLQALPADATISLYAHVPFCDSLCWFCGCHTRVVRRYGGIRAYMETMAAEAALVAGSIPARHRLTHLHFGGGSPSILQPPEIAAFVGRIRDLFALDSGLEFAVEIDPRDIGAEAIAAWVAAGATRASIGVQDFDPRVQAAINRRQSFAQTAQCLERLRASGIGAVNIDLIYGLPHQTEATARATAEQVVALRPDRVAIFGYAHVPWMKPHQRLIPANSLPGAAERLAQADAAASVLTAAGYLRVGLDHFARPDDPMAVAAAAGRLARNFQGYTTDGAAALIGLGASAIGSLPQGYVQNEIDVGRYTKAIAAGRQATARGIAIGPEDRLRRAVIERLMCDLEADTGALCAAHGMPDSLFEPEFRRLAPAAADGLVELNPPRLAVTERGRPFLRSLCATFDAYLAPAFAEASAGRPADSSAEASAKAARHSRAI